MEHHDRPLPFGWGRRPKVRKCWRPCGECEGAGNVSVDRDSTDPAHAACVLHKASFPHPVQKTQRSHLWRVAAVMDSRTASSGHSLGCFASPSSPGPRQIAPPRLKAAARSSFPRCVCGSVPGKVDLRVCATARHSRDSSSCASRGGLYSSIPLQLHHDSPRISRRSRRRADIASARRSRPPIVLCETRQSRSHKARHRDETAPALALRREAWWTRPVPGGGTRSSGPAAGTLEAPPSTKR